MDEKKLLSLVAPLHPTVAAYPKSIPTACIFGAFPLVDSNLKK